MRFELPVIWRAKGETHAGRLELVGGQVTLTAKSETVSFGARSVAELAIERAPTRRLRGLPALSLTLAGGDVVEVASMGGAGSLHELASRIGAGQPVPSRT